MDVVVTAFLAGYAMLIWLNTDAFAEYATLTKLVRVLPFIRVDEYNRLKADGFEGNYVNFLKEYYGQYFLIRLFTCPICLSVWVGLVPYATGTPFQTSGLYSALSLLSYLAFNRML